MVDRSSLYILDDYKSISDTNDYVASASLKDEMINSMESILKNEVKINEEKDKGRKLISAVKNMIVIGTRNTISKIKKLY